MGADGSQDTHNETWGEEGNWTVVLARKLTREAILDAIDARRTYSTHDRNVRMTFVLDDEDMGSQLLRSAGSFPCVVDVADPDKEDTIDKIELYVDGRVAHTTEPVKRDYTWELSLAFGKGRHYCFVKVTQADGNLVYSSPIWVIAH